MIRYICSTLVAALFVLTGAHASPIIGVNGHDNWTTSAYTRDKEDRVFETMAKYHLKTYRIDVQSDPASYATLERLVVLGNKYNISIRPMLYVDKITSNDVYEITKYFVRDITTWEFGNELNLRGRDSFNDSIDKMKIARDGLRRAAADTGVNLKSAINVAAFAGSSGKGLNASNKDYEFLQRAVARGLEFDYISFHYYPNPSDRLSGWMAIYLDPLRLYGKPVILNETNCANIYKGDDGNSEACQLAIRSLLDEISSNYSDLIVEVSLYELLDDPSVPGVEGHFGLMYDLDHPKETLNLISEYAKRAPDAAVPR